MTSSVADILRARLSTVGIEEHVLRMERSMYRLSIYIDVLTVSPLLDNSVEWKIYDCSGLQSQRRE